MATSDLDEAKTVLSEAQLSSEAKTALSKAQTAEDVWQAIKEILLALTSLHIKTVVTGYTSADQAGRNVELSTRIDLLQADRINEMHESFLKDSVLTPLRDFHTQQVALAEQDIQKRLEFVQYLGTAIVNAINATK